MARTRITEVKAAVYRVPIATPVATSFGVMTNRPAVFVRLADQDGAFGWGEIFANWPAAGAEHRARLLIEDIADLVIGFKSDSPSDLFFALTEKTQIRALQCGEWGPFRQVIAGLDTALHDLYARRAGLPLARLLNPGALDQVSAYASGIHVAAAARVIPEYRFKGYRAFKVKIGFDMADDIARLDALLADQRDGERLFTDANQAWDLQEALNFVTRSEDFKLGWLEEPMRADLPAEDWAALKRASRIPIAAGENIVGFDDFNAAIDSGNITYVQPDVAKWGGITGCYAVARRALAAGRSYCPHFLGGGIGLIASAHLLAAAGGDGLLEVDANPNPLRDAFLPGGTCVAGAFHIGHAPGLGVDALPEAIAQYQTLSLMRH